MKDSLLKNLTYRKVLFKYSKGRKYHPILTSGLHSNAYFNLLRLFERSDLFQMILRGFSIEELREAANVSRSLGGMLTLGSHLMVSLTDTFPFFRSHQRIILNKKTAKKFSYWDIKAITQPLLFIDDVISTGSSFISLVNKVNITWAPYIITLVNRSGKDFLEISGKKFKIISSVDLSKGIGVYSEDECPLCKNGSVAIRPKENWEKLFEMED